MPYTPNNPTLRPAFPHLPIPTITYGQPFDQLLSTHIPTTLSSTRVYLIISRSLVQNHPSTLTRLQTALGPALVGTRIGMTSHTRWNEVVSVAADAAKVSPDCIVTVGAGSLTDAAKVIAWMLGNGITTSEGLETMWHGSPVQNHELKAATVRTVAVPTSLSGGEYQALAGVTRDDGTNKKCPFYPPVGNPRLVVLDPELVMTTPERVWLASGVRSVDHCVETLCSLLGNEEGDERAREGLLRLVPALLRTKRNPADVDARFDSMMGVVDAMAAVASGVPLGGSHAIGHQLGPLGVGHGETSCIMLPSVCKYNAKKGANVEKQVACKELLLRSPEVRRLVQEKGAKSEDEMDLGDVLNLVIRELGMPRSLKEVGIGKDKLDALAVNTLADQWAATNAVPLKEKEQVLEILETAVG